MHVDTDKVNPVSFGYYLERSGYTIGYFGKHMNQAPAKPPPGFNCSTCWYFANGGGKDGEPGGYLNATFNDYAGAGLGDVGSVQGRYTGNTNGEYSGYTTAVIANKSITWLHKVAKLDKPWMLTVAPKAPHVPSTPAPWYADRYADRNAPRDPAYNASAELLSNFHWLIAQQPPITTKQGSEIDDLFRKRWQTLLSVDDAIAGVHATVEALGQLDNTYWFVTSDHGYNLGQHRLPSCKLNVYDHDVRIPMVIAGPGILPGTRFSFPASNVDVAPTMMGLAGVQGVMTMDGRSVAPQLIDPADPAVPEATRSHVLEERRGGNEWRDFHLIEYNSLGSVVRTGHLVDDPQSNTYRAIRSVRGRFGNILYAEFTALTDFRTYNNVSAREFFDLDADPHQLHNIISQQSPALLNELHELVASEFVCHGTTCR